MKFNQFCDIRGYVAHLDDKKLLECYGKYSLPIDELERKMKAAAYEEIQYRSSQGKWRFNTPLDRI